MNIAARGLIIHRSSKVISNHVLNRWPGCLSGSPSSVISWSSTLEAFLTGCVHDSPINRRRCSDRITPMFPRRYSLSRNAQHSRNETERRSYLDCDSYEPVISVRFSSPNRTTLCCWQNQTDLFITLQCYKWNHHIIFVVVIVAATVIVTAALRAFNLQYATSRNWRLHMWMQVWSACSGGLIHRGTVRS